jgi:hypothetical protein
VHQSRENAALRRARQRRARFAPGYGPDYYAAFMIDPDGYRIEAYYGPGKTCAALATIIALR